MNDRNNEKVTPEIIQLYNEALARFEGHNEIGHTMVLFCHHEIFAEMLQYPIEERLEHIIDTKPEDEWVTRLTWIQPYIPNKRMEALDSELNLICTEYVRIVKELRVFRHEELEPSDPLSGVYGRVLERIGSFSKELDKWSKRFDKFSIKWCDVYESIFMAEHPECPWNGRTLFSTK